MTDTTPDYGEPWTPATLGKGSIVSSSGTPIIESFKLVKRAIECVNACQGMADPAKEIAEMREALKEAADALKELRSFYIETTGLPPCAANAALAKIQTILKP